MFKISKVHQILFGGFAVCLGVVAVIPSSLNILLTIEILKSPTQSFEYLLSGYTNHSILSGGGPPPLDFQEVTFNYPPKIRENESLVAYLMVDTLVVPSVQKSGTTIKSDTTPKSGETSLFDRLFDPAELSAQLSGPNFEIKPSEFQKVSISTSKKLSWVLQPKKTGRHILLLDISKLARQSGASLSTTSFTASSISGPNISLKLENAEDAIIELPIQVVTIWGLSDLNFQILRAVIGLAAFILATPIAISLLSSLFGARAAIRRNGDDGAAIRKNGDDSAD